MQKPRSKATIPVVLAIIGACVVCVCGSIGGFFVFDEAISSLLNPPGPQPSNNGTTPPVSVITPSAMAQWTVMVYSDADDEVLEASQWFDVNEMELVGSSSEVNIVVQIDRHGASFTGDGNWTTARRLYVTQDSDLNAIHSPILEELGEVDMGDHETLYRFVTWAVENFPAQKYALVMSDHGGGWTGGFTDGSSDSKLSIPDIADALEGALQDSGLERFELFGFDACLMGQIEVFGTFYPISSYMVASEEVIPAYGWAYTGWLTELVQDPSMSGSGLGRAIVSSYVVGDMLLTEARATAEEIAQEEATTTLSVIDSAYVPDVIGAMNQLADAMADLDQRQVAEARTYARNFYSVFGEDVSPSFIDLQNFAQVLAKMTGDSDVAAAALQLETAVSSAVVSEKHGAKMSGSNGISFYFPDSAIYTFTELSGSFPPYGETIDRFLQQSSWDEFMAFHYTAQAYVPQQGQAFVPSRSADVVAPGASELSIGAVQISDTAISGDETVTVSTTVSGDVAYIYTLLYFYNPDTESYWIGDISYYIAENTVDIGGVYSPDYGPSPVQVEYEWSPTLYIMTDGTTEAYALVEPAEYLSADGRTVYAVYGQYTAAGGSEPVDAMLYFDADGTYLYAYAFPDLDDDGASTPVEITPQPGDHFTDYVQLYAFDENDEPYYDYTPSEDVWTWGDEPFSFYAAYPVDGQYAVGIAAYDFDNNFVVSWEYIEYTR
jgi:hypothetical protein